jgi:hypothetical protein
MAGRWWSVDPGERHVGVAFWTGNTLVEAKEMSPTDFKLALCVNCPSLVVIEAFSLRSPRWTGAQAKQAQETLKLIGYVQAHVDEVAGMMEEQQPSVRHVAQASPHWRRLQRTSAVPANSHARSAVAHGLYYLHFAKR